MTGASPRAGCPFGVDRPIDYDGFASIAELHSLAAPSTDDPLEMTFILITQAKEILFRILYVELDSARSALQADSPTIADRHLARACRVLAPLQASWDYLAGISPAEFAHLRQVLGHASGTQSQMYRAVEYILGNRDSRSIEYLAEIGPVSSHLQDEAAKPDLYSETLRFLQRSGVESLRAIDLSDPDRVMSSAVTAAWVEVMQNSLVQADAARLADSLMELAFQFSCWRATHLLVVERVIGTTPGTGGTAGVSWLRKVNEHRHFEHLWMARDSLMSHQL